MGSTQSTTNWSRCLSAQGRVGRVVVVLYSSVRMAVSAGELGRFGRRRWSWLPNSFVFDRDESAVRCGCGVHRHRGGTGVETLEEASTAGARELNA